MLPLIAQLAPGARVLDLGAGPGSFPIERGDIAIVRLDLERPPRLGQGRYVLGDGARMPFAPASFDLIVSNHSLEHFIELDATVAEVGRVLKPGGVLYVAVPDATTLADRIYRWLGRGGGHVNPFRSPQEVAALVERLAGLPVRSTTVLFSSFSFLNHHNFVSPPPRRIALFAYGSETFLAVSLWILRGIDRRCNTRLSVYGWSFVFSGGHGETTGTGKADEQASRDFSRSEPRSGEAWVNVCVRCGSGHSEAYLRKFVPIRKLAGLFASYRCPSCGGFNFLTREFTPRA